MLTLHLESAYDFSFVTFYYALSGIGLRNSMWEQSDSRVYARNETNSRVMSLCYVQKRRVRTFVGGDFSRRSNTPKNKYFNVSSCILFLSFPFPLLILICFFIFAISFSTFAAIHDNLIFRKKKRSRCVFFFSSWKASLKKRKVR